jgi:hypothetical protein
MITKVTAIFPPLNEPTLPADDPNNRTREFEALLPSTNEAVLLELSWREFNAVEEGDHHSERNCRSLSVGDGLRIGDKLFICDGFGWMDVTQEEFDAWCKLPWGKRLMGPKFLLEKGEFKA